MEKENHRAVAAAVARYRSQVHAREQLRPRFVGYSML